MANEINTMDVIDLDTKEGVKRIDFTAGRRAFIRSLGLGVAGAAMLGVPGASQAQSTDMDVAILNFALNLEYLESEFYLHAYYGTGNDPSDVDGGTGTLGAVTGGAQVPFQSSLVKAYAFEIANEERRHVRFLRNALGSSKVNRPAINIGTAFTTAARAAGLITQGQQFNPYENDLNFLLGSYIFEDVGVTAYHGAAPLITDKNYLDAAAGILAVEAYHAGIIRTSLFAMGATPSAATQKISDLRAKLDKTEQSNGQPAPGMVIDDVGVGTQAAPTLVPVNQMGIAFDRTTDQVLNIVYGSFSKKPGLFFPSGMNGAIS